MSPLIAMARKRNVTVEQIRSERRVAREAVEAPKRAAAQKRAELRRLVRQIRGLPPPPPRPRPLTLDEQLDIMRDAAAKRADGDTRSGNELIREAADAHRKPREG